MRYFATYGLFIKSNIFVFVLRTVLSYYKRTERKQGLKQRQTAHVLVSLARVSVSAGIGADLTGESFYENTAI